MNHSIIDPDIHFIVDADDRSITNETNSRVTIMQYDHNSERVSFDIPRYIEEHDMMACDLAVILFTNTGKGTSVSNRSTNSGVYRIQDLAVKKDNPDTLTCSWLISREATQFNGTLKFQLEFICHEDAEAGIPEYNWHTDLCDKIDVKPSLSSSNDIAEVYPDIITEFDKRVDQLETYGVPQDRLNQAISDYLTANPIEKMTESELKAALDAYFIDNPVDEITDEYIEEVIDQYLKDNPISGTGMTTREFNTKVESYISTRPMDSKTENAVKDVIEEYMENNPVSSEDISNAVSNYLDENPVTASGGGKLPLEYYANSLTTSKKIAKYESGDESDDIFMRFEGGSAVWYRGICTGEVEELDDLYWIDEDHTALTAQETEYPVEVYIYDEHIRMGVEIVNDDTFGPKWTFGEGGGYDNPDWGKFFMEKTAELMKLYLLNDAGNEIGFNISNNYVDIKGLRKVTDIDFTKWNWDGGSFTVILDGNIPYTLTMNINSAGYYTITDAIGHVTTIKGVSSE